MLGEEGKPAREVAPMRYRVEYVSPGYLVFAREGVLLAQRFDPGAARMVGEPFPIAPAVSSFLSTGWADFACSTSGTIVYQSHEGVRRMTWFDRSGQAMGTVGPPGRYLGLRISPDGKRLAFSRGPAHDRHLRRLDARPRARDRDGCHLRSSVQRVRAVVDAGRKVPLLFGCPRDLGSASLSERSRDRPGDPDASRSRFPGGSRCHPGWPDPCARGKALGCRLRALHAAAFGSGESRQVPVFRGSIGERRVFPGQHGRCLHVPGIGPLGGLRRAAGFPRREDPDLSRRSRDSCAGAATGRRSST